MVAWYKTHRNFNVKKHRKSENKKHRRASETNMGTIGRRLPHCRCFPGWDGDDVGDGGDDDGGDHGDDYNLGIRNLRLYATGSTIDGDKFKTQILARQVGEIFRLMQKHTCSHKNISKYWWSRWSRRWRCSSWSETYRHPWAGALIIIKCRWQFFDTIISTCVNSMNPIVIIWWQSRCFIITLISPGTQWCERSKLVVHSFSKFSLLSLSSVSTFFKVHFRAPQSCSKIFFRSSLF